ncbi:MAG: DUF885 family protein [Balneolaceae bacterium]
MSLSTTRIFRLLPGCLLLIVWTLQPAGLAAQSQTDENALPLLIETFQQDQGALNRKYNVRNSDEYFDRFERFYREWTDRMETIDFQNLSHDSKVDYKLLQNLINRSSYFLEASRDRIHSVQEWLPNIDGMLEFIQERRVGTKPDAREIATRMHEWTSDIESLKTRLDEHGPLMRHETITINDAVSDIRNSLEDAYEFYYGYDIEFTWWVERPWEQLDGALRDYEEFVSEHFDADAEQLDDSGIVGNPIGRDEIIRRLEFEMIIYTPEELIEIAEHQFAKAEVEMMRAAEELGYDNWLDALEYVKQQHVEPGRKPELILELHNQSVEFIEERDLITIPELARETWRMGMMSPQRQLINPFFTGGEQISISYPTNTMEHNAKMMSLRGNNPHFNRATVQHELIPGHHLQQFMTRRYKTYRSPFSTSFWGEGWALYWEMLLWDEGFAETPEDRIGMLFWRTHRYARIIFSLNYHLGNWTPQQSIDYLVERVGHEYANAEAEVRRSFMGNYGPLYQIAYMIGGMQIHALYKDLVDTGQMTAKEFHDTILKENRIPIRMVKSILTGEDLERDSIDDWHFADYIYE